MALKKDQKVIWKDYPRGPVTGWVKRVAKDGSWAIIEARTGLGATFESRRYSGPALEKWQPE